MLIDLGGGRLPASEAAFTKALDDLAQPSNDGVTFIVTGAAAFIQPCVEADTGCSGRSAVWPAGDAQCGSQLTSCSRKAKPKGRTMGLTTR